MGFNIGALLSRLNCFVQWRMILKVPVTVCLFNFFLGCAQLTTGELRAPQSLHKNSFDASSGASVNLQVDIVQHSAFPFTRDCSHTDLDRSNIIACASKDHNCDLNEIYSAVPDDIDTPSQKRIDSTSPVLHKPHIGLRPSTSEVSQTEESEIWVTAVQNGEKMLKMMMDSNAVPSEFELYSDLRKYGWIIYIQNVVKTARLQQMLSALGTKPSEGIDVQWNHEEGSNGLSNNGTQLKYNPTHGVYQADYYPRHGLIVATNSNSPESEAYQASKKEFRASGGGSIVPLARQSDILYLEWEHLVNDPASIKWFVRASIVNSRTKSIMFRALDRAGVNHGPLPFPGTTFHMNTDEGKAILGTVNGKTIGYFLAQHQKRIGHKTVRSVTVFDDLLTHSQRESWDSSTAANDILIKPALLFEIVEQNEGEEQPTDNARAQPHDDQAPEDATRGKLQPLLRRYGRSRKRNDNNTWDKALTKGKKLRELIDNQYIEDSQWRDYSYLHDYGWDCARFATFPSPKKQLSDAVEAVTSWRRGESTETKAARIRCLHETSSIPSKGYKNSKGKLQPFPPTHAYYWMDIWPKWGVFIIERAKSPTQAVKEKGGTDEPVVPLGRLSDVGFLVYQQQANDVFHVPSRNIRYLIQAEIENKASKEVIWQAVRKKTGKGIQPWADRTMFSGESDEAAAILSTANGAVNAYLLAQHRSQLGWKRIESIHVWWESRTPLDRNDKVTYEKNGLPCLLFTLKDRRAGRGARSLVNDTQARRYNDLALLASQAVQPLSALSGRYLWRRANNLAPSTSSDISNAIRRGSRRLELLEAFVVPGKFDSPFVYYTDIKQYGWTRTATRVKSGTAPEIRKALEALECWPRDPKRAGWRVAFKHDQTSVKTYIPEDNADTLGNRTPRPYLPTGAEAISTFFIKQGVIVLDYYNPPFSALQQRTSFTTSFTGEMVPLSWWMDLGYLEWSHLAINKKGHQIFKHILTPNVADVKTTAVIWSVLERARASSGNQGPPPWPGLVLDITSDSAKAVMGTPLGREIFLFLVGYSRPGQLGRNTVGSITIYDDTTDAPARKDYQKHGKPCLLFSFEAVGYSTSAFAGRVGLRTSSSAE